MSAMRVDRSLQKKKEKTSNQHARIPHIGKAGTPYVLGGCCDRFFTFFYLFAEEGSFQIPDLASPDFYKADFLTFRPRIWTGWPARASPDLDPGPDFFSCFVQIFYVCVVPCIVKNRPLYRETTK
jgi:hypothetical protein